MPSNLRSNQNCLQKSFRHLAPVFLLLLCVPDLLCLLSIDGRGRSGTNDINQNCLLSFSGFTHLIPIVYKCA